MTSGNGNGPRRERRQIVRYAFYKLDPAWRRLPPEEQAESKTEFAEVIEHFGGRLLLRTYSLVGTRGDADFMLWQVADDLETLHALAAGLNSTHLAAYLSQPYAYLAMTRRSIYDIREASADGGSRTVIRPGDSKYLFVYPFVKTRPWYALSKEERQVAMDEHIRIGRKYPDIHLNTTYSYGLDDQEFVVAFEGDDPASFLDLVMELRESVASAYTLRDTPTFSCIQMSLREMLDALGGETMSARSAPSTRADGYIEVARLQDLPPGSSRRVYATGQAVALFNVAGRLYAIGNRCTHARASLSEGTVEGTVLTCPWHNGKFDLCTGHAVQAPATGAVPVYDVKVEDEKILIAPRSALRDGNAATRSESTPLEAPVSISADG